MKKRIICVVLALVLFVGGATTAVAMGVAKNITAELRPDMTIIIDGEVKKFVDANGATVYPITYQGTTYLPVRAIGGLMGKEVGWDGATTTVTLKSPSYDLGGSLVYEDNAVCIRFSRCYQGSSYYSDYYYAEFTVQNKTDAELTFQCDALGFNGISYNNLMGSDDVAANSTGKIKFYTDDDVLPTTGITKVSGKIRVIDFAKSVLDMSYDASFTNIEVK